MSDVFIRLTKRVHRTFAIKVSLLGGFYILLGQGLPVWCDALALGCDSAARRRHENADNIFLPH